MNKVGIMCNNKLNKVSLVLLIMHILTMIKRWQTEKQAFVIILHYNKHPLKGLRYFQTQMTYLPGLGSGPEQIKYD